MARFPMGVPYGWEYDEDTRTPASNSPVWKTALVKYNETHGLAILSDSQLEE